MSLDAEMQWEHSVQNSICGCAPYPGPGLNTPCPEMGNSEAPPNWIDLTFIAPAACLRAEKRHHNGALELQQVSAL